MSDLLRDIETAANCLDRAGEFPTGASILREAAASIRELETQLAEARADVWNRAIDAVVAEIRQWDDYSISGRDLAIDRIFSMPMPADLGGGNE